MLEKQRATEQAIADTLELVHAALVRFYADGDVGTVIINVGQAQMRVEATPKRISDPIKVETK
jgi:hypothetical protein